MTTIGDITVFLRNHSEKLSEWPVPTLMQYLKHHAKFRNIGVVHQGDGRIVGVGIARVVNRHRRDQIKNPWRTSEQGNVLYIDNVVALHPAIVPRLWNLMVKRFGKRRFTAGRRHGKIKFWHFDHYDAKMQILTKMKGK